MYEREGENERKKKRNHISIRLTNMKWEECKRNKTIHRRQWLLSDNFHILCIVCVVKCITLNLSSPFVSFIPTFFYIWKYYESECVCWCVCVWYMCLCAVVLCLKIYKVCRWCCLWNGSRPWSIVFEIHRQLVVKPQAVETAAPSAAASEKKTPHNKRRIFNARIFNIYANIRWKCIRPFITIASSNTNDKRMRQREREKWRKSNKRQ